MPGNQATKKKSSFSAPVPKPRKLHCRDCDFITHAPHYIAKHRKEAHPINPASESSEKQVQES